MVILTRFHCYISKKLLSNTYFFSKCYEKAAETVAEGSFNICWVPIGMLQVKTFL